MHYQLYVAGAYAVTFIVLAVMFTTSYNRYKKAKAELAETKEQAESN